MTPLTLVDLFCHGAAHRPALSAPDGLELDYAQLCNAADAIGAALSAHGAAPGDVVAAALPDGAAFVAAFAGTAAARAVFAPLADPGMLGRLRPRLVLAPAAVPQSLRVAARALGIPVLSVAFDGRGEVLVDGEPVYEAHGRTAQPEDPAWLGGDEAPLTHAALAAAAYAGARSAPASLRPALPLGEPSGLVVALPCSLAGAGCCWATAPPAPRRR